MLLSFFSETFLTRYSYSTSMVRVVVCPSVHPSVCPSVTDVLWLNGAE